VPKAARGRRRRRIECILGPACLAPRVLEATGFDPSIALADESCFVIEGPDGEALRVPIKNSAFESRLELDPGVDSPHPTDDVGTFLRFKCVGDERGRGYFFGQSAHRGGSPAKCEWVVEYAKRGSAERRCRFSGALYGYRERPRPDGEWAFLGTIKMSA